MYIVNNVCVCCVLEVPLDVWTMYSRPRSRNFGLVNEGQSPRNAHFFAQINVLNHISYRNY